MQKENLNQNKFAAEQKSYRSFVTEFAEHTGAIWPVSELICVSLLKLIIQRIRPEEGRVFIAGLPRGFRGSLENAQDHAPNHSIKQDDFKNAIIDVLPEAGFVDWLLMLRKFGKLLYRSVPHVTLDRVRMQLPNEIDRLLFTPAEEDEPVFSRTAM